MTVIPSVPTTFVNSIAAAIDPNVQVAMISIIATVITTSGVVLVAIINNKKERGKAASVGVEAGLNEKDVLGRMLSLITENERKESEIVELKKQVKTLKSEIRVLKAQNAEPKGPQ